eukprot:SAG11_NODE_26949_length_338_cov_15.711297_1_plen_53_part_01
MIIYLSIYPPWSDRLNQQTILSTLASDEGDPASVAANPCDEHVSFALAESALD